MSTAQPVDMVERLSQAVTAVTTVKNPDAAIQAFVDATRVLLDAEYAALGIPGEAGRPMAHFYFSGVSDSVIRALGAPPNGHGVLGQLLTDGKPIRLAMLAEHPATKGFPSAHPFVTSFLGLGVPAGGEVVANLYYGNKIGATEFSAEDERLAEMLAGHAAAAIQSLKLQDQEFELARLMRDGEQTIQLHDDMLQTLFATDLRLRQLDASQPEDMAAQVREVQKLIAGVVDRLREKLLI